MTLSSSVLVRWGRGFCYGLVSLMFTACVVQTGGNNSPAPFELVGTWVDNYGGTTALGQHSWGRAELIAYDNIDNWAVTQMPEDDEWNPSKFSLVVWTEATNETFWTCTVADGLDSEDEAFAQEITADARDPATSGCGDFAWTRMQRELEVVGHWESEWGSEIIDGTSWGTAAVRAWNNLDNWVILQMPETDEWNPSKYSRQIWTEALDGTFYYCTVAYGLGTHEEAEAAHNTADASDPATSGCGDFAWTALSLSK
jgi:hypothetical protein